MSERFDLPAKIALGNGTVLRFFEESDAPAVALAVGESLEHLKPWMPWADAQSASAFPVKYGTSGVGSTTLV